MNDAMKDSFKEIDQAAKQVQKACQDFIDMDINEKPVEAILVEIKKDKQDIKTLNEKAKGFSFPQGPMLINGQWW